MAANKVTAVHRLGSSRQALLGAVRVGTRRLVSFLPRKRSSSTLQTGAPGTWDAAPRRGAEHPFPPHYGLSWGSFRRGLPGFLSDLGIRTVMARVLHWRNTTIERRE